MASLKFFYGCMGSAKTLRLLTTAFNFEERGIGFLIYKPEIDTRDGLNVFQSRAGLNRGCLSISKNFDFIHECRKIIQELDIKFILIDEAQFLTASQVEQLVWLVVKHNVNVFCYGLRTDFKTMLFDGSKRLFELADDIEEIPSMCSCGKKTIVNARIVSNGCVIHNGEQIEIGGDNQYKSICRECWY